MQHFLTRVAGVLIDTTYDEQITNTQARGRHIEITADRGGDVVDPAVFKPGAEWGWCVYSSIRYRQRPDRSTQEIDLK